MRDTSGFLSVRRSVAVGIILLAVLPLGTVPERPSVSPLAETSYATRTHDVGLLSVPVSNSGQLGAGKYADPNWQGGNYLGICGLWVGAYVIGGDGQPRVSTIESTEFRPSLDPLWSVYESYEGIPHGNRFTDQDAGAADDDADGLVNEDFQNGYDDDGDGQIDEDYEAVGQQMFSCMYRDDTPDAIATLPDHQPLNILVQQRSFQWAAPGISEWVGLDFTVINVGEQRLTEVYLGFYADFDAGSSGNTNYWKNDLAGWSRLDTTVAVPGGMGLCATRDIGVDAVWVRDTGGEPGVVGAAVFGHTTDDAQIRAPQTVGTSTIQWLPTSEIPTDDSGRYQLMAAGTKPAGNATLPDDYRCLIVAGPFYQLYPGESRSFQVAVVIGDGIPGFLRNLAAAKTVYDGEYIDADQNPNTGIGGRERCLQVLEPGTVVVWDDPCDTLNTEVIYRSTPPCNVDGIHYVDADCDPCTGIAGRETHLNWVGEILPVSVELLSFTAERSGASAVLRWTVGSARDHAGFHVYREEPGSERVRITGSLLAGRSEYAFVDTEAPPGSADYWLLELNRAGVGTWYGPVSLAPASGRVLSFRADRAAPNPFRSRMRLAYRLPEARPVRVSVYDLSGRLVRVVRDAVEGAGDHFVIWDGETGTGSRARAGLYILKLEAGPDALTRKVVLVE